MAKKLILIDGHALIFKTYYAFLRRPMVNSKGRDTSILFGFTKIITDLLIKERPTHFAVAFDPPAKTFRHELYPLYKANRSETPELIKESLKPLCEIMDAISVPVLMKDGFEADDVIGTYAKIAEKEGFKVYMVTPDKDYGQLLSDNIYQYKPGKSGSEHEIIGKKEICNQYGIQNPSQIIDILTIWGDSSDNIPGVKGIGEVGSKKLVGQYQNIDNIYKNLYQLPARQQEAFKEASAYIELSRKLITIDTEVDIPWDEKKLELNIPDYVRITELFQEYEFSSLVRTLPQLKQLFSGQTTQLPTPVKTETKEYPVWELSSSKKVSEVAAKTGYLAVKTDETQIHLGSGGVYRSVNIGDELSSEIEQLLNKPSLIICGYNLKGLLNILATHSFSPKGYLADLELMHYLISPERSHKLDMLARTYLNHLPEEPASPADLFSSNQQEDPQLKAMKELPLMHPLFLSLSEELKNQELKDLYEIIEMPLIKVLAQMEFQGVKIDTEMLSNYSKELTLELNDIEKKVRELADEPSLNISSPKQLGVILYEKLKLTGNAKRTSKKNYSTDEETLSGLSDKHPIIPLILEYRNLKKLLSTYIDPLPSLISKKSGKIHTTYNQSLTATGRLSSIKPNLQNIPVRTERGREIRKAFVSSFKDGVILSADYSQIELRLMAHMSEDSDFIEAFNQGKDIHAATASKIFGVPEEQLTREQRNRAKVANFGIIYGISAFGLSQRLSIPRHESKQLIEEYFASYPGVERYMKEMTEKAKKDGFVSTLYGRKRFLPDINSKNPVVRGLAQRNAINAPIQGSAADIIKVAMIRVQEEITKRELKSKMVMQVHDELVFDAPEQEARILSEIVKTQMESVINLKVPLTVECHWGVNWLEAH